LPQDVKADSVQIEVHLNFTRPAGPACAIGTQSRRGEQFTTKGFKARRKDRAPLARNYSS
jgi:hypothetical protein